MGGFYKPHSDLLRCLLGLGASKQRELFMAAAGVGDSWILKRDSGSRPMELYTGGGGGPDLHFQVKFFCFVSLPAGNMFALPSTTGEETLGFCTIISMTWSVLHVLCGRGLVVGKGVSVQGEILVHARFIRLGIKDSSSGDVKWMSRCERCKMNDENKGWWILSGWVCAFGCKNELTSSSLC